LWSDVATSGVAAPAHVRAQEARMNRPSITRRRGFAAAATAVAVTLALGACGDDDDDALTSEETDEGVAVAQAEATTESSTDDAAEQLEELQAQFPITVEASLDDFDVIGGYTLSMTEAFCDGFPECGSPRADVHADIIQGSNGLELQIPTVLTTGLFSTNGSLFAVTDSDMIVQPCGDTPRNARVSITIFADGVEVALDGTRTLTGLGASLLVEGNELNECGEAVVFFAAELIPD
jgi:hypothetical protein